MRNSEPQMKAEKLLEQFSRTLRRLDLPDSLRQKNRRRIEAALEAGPTEKTTPWRRRRLSVPVPVAAGFLLLFGLELLLSGLYVKGRLGGDPPAVAAKTPTQSTGRVDRTDEPEIVEQGTYIAGIGFTEKTKLYYYQRENEYEKR